MAFLGGYVSRRLQTIKVSADVTACLIAVGSTELKPANRNVDATFAISSTLKPTVLFTGCGTKWADP